MAKSPQILQIEPPAEIIFKGPFHDVVTRHLDLTNPSDRQVVFKVKTTAPKQYCVRPNSGFIPPKSSVKVAVMLQPFDYNAEEKSRHKFMVQTAYAPEGETSLETIWKNTSGGDCMDSKLRVVFEMPETNSLDSAASKMATPQKQATPNMEAEVRKLTDDKKRLQSELNTIEQEKNQLRERLKMMESPSARAAGSASTATGGDVKLMHCILVALLAVLVGFVVAKLI